MCFGQASPDDVVLATILSGFRKYARDTCVGNSRCGKNAPNVPWSNHGVLGKDGREYHLDENLFTQFSTPKVMSPVTGPREWISFEYKAKDALFPRSSEGMSISTKLEDTAPEVQDAVLHFICHFCRTSNTTSSDKRGSKAETTRPSRWSDTLGCNIVKHATSKEHHVAYLAYHKGHLHCLQEMAAVLNNVSYDNTSGKDPLSLAKAADIAAKYRELKKYVNWRETLVQRSHAVRSWEDDNDALTTPTATPVTVATLSRLEVPSKPSASFTYKGYTTTP